MPRLNNLVQ
eukprot:CCRYP_002785-RA/>CCRYP_002785-RA protein AED:0.46 eAED:0.46 QI:0/-1/0/1/-1/0/1/0/9